MTDDVSSNPPSHEELREMLGMHALDLLEPDERAAIEEHLASCESCRAELAELASLGPLLRQVDPTSFERSDQHDRHDRREPPAELTAQVQASIDERLQGSAAQPSRRQMRGRRWLVGSAAAAVLVAVGGVTGWWLAPRPPDVPFENVAVSVQQSATNGEVTVTAGVIPHTWGVEVRLTGSGFTAGEHYVVQVVDDAGARRDAGEFIGTGGRPMVCNLNSSVTRAQAAGFVVLDEEQRTVVSSTF